MKKISKGKKRISLYKKLVASYVIFALLSLVIMGLSMLIVTLLVSEGKPYTGNPYLIKNEAECRNALSSIQNLNGWVEELTNESGNTGIWGEENGRQKLYIQGFSSSDKR